MYCCLTCLCMYYSHGQLVSIIKRLSHPVGREPLGDQVGHVLTIECVRMADAAMYTCRATNDVNTLFSNWAEVIVQKPPVLRKRKLVCVCNKT